MVSGVTVFNPSCIYSVQPVILKALAVHQFIRNVHWYRTFAGSHSFCDFTFKTLLANSMHLDFLCFTLDLVVVDKVVSRVDVIVEL